MAASNGPTPDRRHAAPELRGRPGETCVSVERNLRINHPSRADPFPLDAKGVSYDRRAPMETLATLSLWRQSAQGQWGGFARR
jgi:hypothetical protein